MNNTIPVELYAQPEQYKMLGMKPGTPEVWEDSLRTSGAQGEYEWWYFDSKLEGGGNLVIVFYTISPMDNQNGGFAPYATLNLTLPDGTEIRDRLDPAEGDFSFAKDHCCVRIGQCLFEGDLHDYQIHYESEQVRADVKLHGNVPAWRTGTGHIFFGESDYFAWIPAVPEGSVQVSIVRDGNEESYTGTGYHDHNWGNIGMFVLMHHWYWGRCKVGDYQIISSYITAGPQYGYAHTPVFMLAKGGEIISDTNVQPVYEETDLAFDEVTGKHYFKTLIYDYDDGRQHYRITYRMEEMLEQDVMIKQEAVRVAMMQQGLDPTYTRFSGTAVVERLENGAVVEHVDAPALWELMYFGLDAQV